MRQYQQQLDRFKQGSSHNFASTMTTFTGDTVDWANSAGLVKTRTTDSVLGLWTKYSSLEYGVRAGIIGLMIVGAVGYQCGNNVTNDDSIGGFLFRTTTTLAGMLIGGVASHEIVIRPKINARKKYLREKDSYETDIATCMQRMNMVIPATLDQWSELKQVINNQLTKINDSPLPKGRPGDAANNLIVRRNIMEAISEKLVSQFTDLTSDNAVLEVPSILHYWQQSLETILQKMINENAEVGMTLAAKAIVT